MEITFFTPGQLTQPGLPLAPYRSPTAAGALGPYLEAYTEPGDLVIDLFCQGPTLMHEAVQAGRRALGLNVNRALLLAASLGLTAVERQVVEAAFTHLAETRKGPQTLQAHIEGLYRTSCITCGATTTAEAFVWERDGDAPVSKRYRCDNCSDAGGAPVEAPVDEADRATAARFERRGLSYWLLLDRAAPGDAPQRERIASLLELYTPRNLAAVNDLLLKSDGLTLAPPARQVLDALLLETLDLASSLRSPEAFTSRPRRLQHPARYVEANVWRLFEHVLEVWREMPLTPVDTAPDLAALLSPAARSPASSYLAPLSSGQAARELPGGCAALIAVDPPRPDTVLWHLSALWCHWLWGAQAGDPLSPFLNRRWLDKEWLWRGLRGAFRTVAPLLRRDGRLVCIFADESPVILEALTLAAAGSRYQLVGWGARPPGEGRLVWRYDRESAQAAESGSAGTPAEADALSRAMAERSAAASLNTLRSRGEPVAWPTLHAAVHADLAEHGLLARVATLADEAAGSETLPGTLTQPLSWLADAIRSALGGAPLRQLTLPPTDRQPAAQPLWWLDVPLEREAASPLSDRVELAVSEILRDLLAVTETDLQRRVCARFPGPQTPDGSLIRLCLFSYGDEHAPGHWRLRAEDNLEARTAEADAVVADLKALGRRLGFDVAAGRPHAGAGTVRWLEGGSTDSAPGSTGSPYAVYAFTVRTTAILGDLFESSGPSPPQGATAPETIPCLTLPGGRAVLVGYKLLHDPRLRQQVERHGWQFLKFRHLRHLVREVAARQLDRFAFQAALGLDPIVEREEAQLSLW